MVRNRILSSLIQIVSGDLSYFGGAAVDEAVAGRVRAEQIGIVKRYLQWMVVANACNAAIFVAAVWNSPERMQAMAWALMVMALSGLQGVRGLRSRGAKRGTASPRTIRRAVRNAFTLGCLWAALPLLFFAGASSGGQLIITCLCAGMLGGAAFTLASIPAAAIAFTSPIFIASAITIARSGDEVYFLVALLMVVYTVVLLRGVFAHALQLTDRLVAQINVEREVRRDALTNLPNRISFHENLEDAVALIRRSGERFALLYLDLDDFKLVNDQMGHAAGDELLIQVAERLREAVRSVDKLARLSGDEFAVLAMGVGKSDQARALADRIVRAFDPPFVVDGRQIAKTVSIGIAMAPADGNASRSLLKCADLALYRAKRGLGGSVQFFDPQSDASARERRAIEHDLRGALQRNEFFLHFQPILDLARNGIVGFEALLRWNHPVRGLLAPADFIVIAEDTELIHAIGEWVLREACGTAATWPPDIRIAVNVSATQFRGTGLLPAVVNALAAAKIAASRLEIEITESVVVSESDHAVAMLRALRELGVCIALDDFGTGYSSLSYLRKLPLDKIKIDHSFIHDMLADRDCNAIVKSVVALARDLGMTVTAEGVETAEQLSHLRAIDCAEAQGYFIGAPASAEDTAARLKCDRDRPVRVA